MTDVKPARSEARFNDIQSGPNKGLPGIANDAFATSFFEFWPVWVMYLPVVFYSVFLAIKHRGLSLPLLANPNVFLGGMIGESKTELLDSAGSTAKDYILPYFTITVSNSKKIDAQVIKEHMEQDGFSFPVVAKPDLGCRGAGVQLVQGDTELAHYLKDFPSGQTLVIQQLSQYQAEAGVFYVRHPNDNIGQVVSITLKYRATVVGDGTRTVGDLVKKDARAQKLISLYKQRMQQRWNDVLTKGQEQSLVFAGSHCRGSIFKDGCGYITPALSKKIDTIMQDFPSFHYGRLDIKFDTISDFVDGHKFEIIEVNGASSEQTHIWDSQTGFKSAIKALLWQYRTLFEFGAAHRKAGLTPPSVWLLVKTWLADITSDERYPPTH